MFDYKGAVHIHSNYSFDAKTSIKDIVQSAKINNLDFIVITDHYTLGAKRDGWEGYQDGVLVIVGEEITPRYNHYIAMGIENEILEEKDQDNPQVYINKVKRQGGIGLIAHPHHKGALNYGIKEYPWQDWNCRDYEGLSVWDLMTDWQENLTGTIKALFAYLFPTWFLKGPKQETLRKWDEVNKQAKVAGFGEIDNHDSVKKVFNINFRVFPFNYAFSTIRTHIILEEALSKDSKTAIHQVYNSIKTAKLYVAQERWNNATGFEFKIYNEKEAARKGGEIKLESGCLMLEVKLPKKALIKVLCDGQVIKEEAVKNLKHVIYDKGLYRVEVQQKIWGFYKPWIYSNHIHVF